MRTMGVRFAVGEPSGARPEEAGEPSSPRLGEALSGSSGEVFGNICGDCAAAGDLSDALRKAHVGRVGSK